MSLDFALIAHQESWQAATDVLSVLRGPALPPIPMDEVKDILPWIPPRPICHIEHRSTLGHASHGVYIESFIPPDRLGFAHRRDNIALVRQAAASAISLGARIVSLGGFSSILIEGDSNLLPPSASTVFTTGNTLTVAFIIQGIEKMCALQHRSLADSTVLIVGATGDVGSGCARCLAPQVKGLILNARQLDRLELLAAELNPTVPTHISTNLHELTTLAHPQIHIVICVASLESPSLLLGRLARNAIICDAGYPKNLAPPHPNADYTVFYGGLGQSTAGMIFSPDVHRVLHRHPFPNVAQGCMLEGMVLALENRFEPFSRGRGHITPARVAEILAIANRHGIHLAPLYNSAGPIEPRSLLTTPR